ncbi:MAG: hypothetical protein KIS92_03240 [Planctomycetota bacterium]|nr:hypothetical protein [Planctomycetota bacterium]
MSFIAIFFILRWLLRELQKPESEPDRFELYLAQHGPPWLKRLLKHPLYADEAAIIAVLIAASGFYICVWLIDLLMG